MTIDDRLRWFVLAGEGIVKDYGLAGKIIFYINVVNHPRFPFRVMIEYGKIKQGFTMEAGVTLKKFERQFEENIKNVKKNQSASSSLFGL